MIQKDASLVELVRAVRTVAGGKPYIDAALASLMLEGGGIVEARLTRREIEVLQLLADGSSNETIASALHIAPGHRSHPSAQGDVEAPLLDADTGGRNRHAPVAHLLRRAAPRSAGVSSGRSCHALLHGGDELLRRERLRQQVVGIVRGEVLGKAGEEEHAEPRDGPTRGGRELDAAHLGHAQVRDEQRRVQTRASPSRASASAADGVATTA